MKTSKLFKSVVCLMLVFVMAISMAACSTTASNNADTSSKGSSNSDTITVVWYPNESAATYDSVRAEFDKLITQATGKKVIDKTTTDYTIAVAALADGTAQIGAQWGAVGYIQAQMRNAAVKALIVNTGASGTLDDAYYWSTICVTKENADKYKDASGNYSIAGIQGKKMSFVSTSSTSGFVIPTTAITSAFKSQDKWKDLNQDAFTQGGADKFFSEVLFGQSHQGSAANLMTGKCDVAAFDDTDLLPYVNKVSGATGANQIAAGDVFQVKEDAQAPFDTVRGKQYVVLSATQVQNGPCVYNSKALSADDLKKIQALFTSDTVTNDQLIFVPKDSKATGLLKQSGKNHYITVDDSWYDPIRNLMK